MESNFENTIKNLEIIEKEYDNLLYSYNQDLPSYVLDNYYYKLETIAYKFLVEGFSLLNLEERKTYMAYAKMGLTFISYALTAASTVLIKEPQFTVLALGGSLFLSLKRRYDNTNDPFINKDELIIVADKINNFNIKAGQSLELISKRIDELNSEEYISSLPSDKQCNLLASKTIMGIIYHEFDNFEISEELKKEIINLLNDNFNTNETNFQKLIEMELDEVNKIDSIHDKYEKQTNRSSKKRYNHIL